MPRLLLLGAHPDDAEFHAGGLVAAYRQRGDEVKLVSVTDGGAGHQSLPRAELVKLRREEARRAGLVVGATYETWDFPDGQLQPTLAVRERIIRELRSFQPDLVLTHRPWDYHPDHRAVGQAVQDASYLVTVPSIVPDVPHLARDPVVAYMVDLFTKPCPLQPDVLLDVAPYLATIIAMLDCHVSQVYDWLPYNQGLAAQVPSDGAARRAWLEQWYCGTIRARADRFRDVLRARRGPAADTIQYVEAYELSEYAGRLDASDVERFFPGSLRPDPRRG